MINLLLTNTVSEAFNSLVMYMEDLSIKIGLDYILYGCLGLLALILLVTIVRTSLTYEAKLLKRTKQLNKYLAKKQNIDDNNLVEFNNKMKQMPKTVRHNWQDYMLFRDRPSKYLNCSSCIDIPTRVSAYQSSIRVCKIFINIVSFLGFLFGLGNYYSITGYGAYTIFFLVLLVPIFVFVIGHLFVAFLNARHTAIMSDLYYSFQQFEKNLDIACKTLPEVIDYEILFTKKEIKENIPALQEYLEKAEALEKKRKEDEAMLALIGENYDFEELGVDNSLLLERAMKESEKYLNVKRNFSERIRSKEQEKVNYQKNFDEVTKDFERKAQASREIINSLSEQINATTVKIEANYLKKKLNEEQARYQQYEKDYDLASTRFQKEQHDIQYEIDKFNEEIKRRKDQATENMMSEAKTYVNKIYGQVTETVLKQNAPVLDENQITINKLNEEVARLNETLSAKENEIKEKEKKIDEVRQELNLRLAELESTKTLRDYITSEEFRTRLVMSKRDLKKLAKEDREAFKHTKKEMQQPFDNSAAEDAGVQVVKLEDTFNNEYNQEVAAKEADVQVVKLPDADDKTDDYITKNELREIKADLEAANKKLDENTNDLNEQISKVKGKKEPQTKSLNNLKDRMSKLNAKTKQALNEEPAAPAKKTTTPKFNVPKIKK